MIGQRFDRLFQLIASRFRRTLRKQRRCIPKRLRLFPAVIPDRIFVRQQSLKAQAAFLIAYRIHSVSHILRGHYN